MIQEERRGSRRRLLGSLALAISGALLGAGLVAWRTHTLPFADSRCWDSVSSGDLDALFGGGDTGASEVRPAWTPNGVEGRGSLDGTCRVTSGDRQLDIHVHRLTGGLGKDNLPWAEAFLSASLTPLGHGLLGMASDTRAWVALPSGCVDPSAFSGYAVVDVAMGYDGFWDSRSRDAQITLRKALARTAVHVTNGSMAALGCSGSLPEPGGSDPAPTPRPVGADRRICGVAGVRLPRDVGSNPSVRMTSGTDDPVRTCDVVAGDSDHPQYRLETVRRDGLGGAFAGLESSTGPGIPAEGRRDMVGAYAPTLAVVYAKCRDDSVLFMAQQKDGTHGYTFIRQAFPAYVAAEAGRLGCGPLEIRIPD
ncbi:hypothetical protein AB0C13_04285 [Streptomyces sp. NPDC049099]|uniref:hypothetical protein n=1 Tax=Streptomyces sp. NPDC049099 TaxID=3155768 RepID=UPI00343B36E1